MLDLSDFQISYMPPLRKEMVAVEPSTSWLELQIILERMKYTSPVINQADDTFEDAVDLILHPLRALLPRGRCACKMEVERISLLSLIRISVFLILMCSVSC